MQSPWPVSTAHGDSGAPKSHKFHGVVAYDAREDMLRSWVPEHQNVVGVDEQMPERTLIVIRLEECAVPVDAVEMHVTLCWWNVDQTSLTKKINTQRSR